MAHRDFSPLNKMSARPARDVPVVGTQLPQAPAVPMGLVGGRDGSASRQHRRP